MRRGIASLIARAARGQIQVLIDRSFALAKAGVAHACAVQRWREGRVVTTV